ncbi:MAG: adenylate/guanylate cyclase domain-containing protein [Flavobacteriales bacterium]|nr:adenylate/guanylate cyclase domain-containing protein [Flavobacteriales bacterium]
MRLVFSFLAFVLLPCVTLAQSRVTERGKRAWADSVYAVLDTMEVKESASTLVLADSLLSIYVPLRDSCRIARLHSTRSMCFDGLGKLDSALSSVQRALRLFRSGCDSAVLFSAYANLTNIYLSLGDPQLVDSVTAQALRLWNPLWKRKNLRNALLTNSSISRASQGDRSGALVGFKTILRLSREEGNVQDEYDALANLGTLMGMFGELDSADTYFRISLNRAIVQGHRDRQMIGYFNLANNAFGRMDVDRAIALFDSANVIANEIGDLAQRVSIELELSKAYDGLGDERSALEHLQNHRVLNDSLMNTEKVKAVTEMQEKYESEKKVRMIQELKLDQLASRLKQVQLKRTRNIYLFAGIGGLFLAGGLWNRLRYTRRSRAAIQKEKDVSEGLLLNILPEEVAAELKEKGYADAKEFGTATILFSDFKGFTELSEKLTADELIKELNHCFKAFDFIMGKYHVEKIKTIGDAYMAAGGLPDTTKGSPADVVMAALDMQAFMHGYGAERKAEGRPYFTMRVGLHTGGVIAGIVGVKKFAYDIWGDTVNTASRMESSGEVGRVNISQFTYDLVKEDARFNFTPRGKVAAKGKGDMEMWFVDRV